jgi:UDP-N-acetylglucosamine transferase subunit ALG13
VNTGDRAHDVLVLSGTDHHEFRRLVDWVERWLTANPSRSALVQHGFTPPPSGQPRASYVSFLEHTQIAAHLARARAVVCHGGPGTIVDCRRAGLVPVVVPRSADGGEHVDNHQQMYTARLHAEHLIDRADGYEQFTESMSAALVRDRTNLETLDVDVVTATVAVFTGHVEAALRRRDGRRIARRRTRRPAA